MVLITVYGDINHKIQQIIYCNNSKTDLILYYSNKKANTFFMRIIWNASGILLRGRRDHESVRLRKPDSARCFTGWDSLYRQKRTTLFFALWLLFSLIFRRQRILFCTADKDVCPPHTLAEHRNKPENRAASWVSPAIQHYRVVINVLNYHFLYGNVELCGILMN